MKGSQAFTEFMKALGFESSLPQEMLGFLMRSENEKTRMIRKTVRMKGKRKQPESSSFSKFRSEPSRTSYIWPRVQHHRRAPRKGDNGAQHFEPHRPIVSFDDVWHDAPHIAWLRKPLN